FRAGLAKADAAASMPGPVQAVLPGYAKLTRQEAALVTTGVYPLSTVTASIQRTADLMTSVGMIRKQLNVASMIARSHPGNAGRGCSPRFVTNPNAVQVRAR